MRNPRRYFLKRLAGVLSLLIGGTQLAGCLGESDSQQSAGPGAAMQTSSPTTPPAESTPAIPPAGSSESGPVWQASPTIEFIEGVPAQVSVRGFLLDPNAAQLVITMNSGALLPGITWNPSNAVIAYDGRPLGAKPGAPAVVTGITFAADDRRN